MPVGLLFTVGFLGACTFLALVPVRRPRFLALLSFGLGGNMNELPQLAAVLVVAATALAYAQGDLHGPNGLIAPVIAGLTVVGSGVLLARGLRSRSAVDAALRGAFPDIANGRSPRATVRATLRTLLAPYPSRPRQVVRVADLSYGPADPAHRLDVYTRRSPQHAAPILLYLHGGGYTSGGKHREARALLNRFAGRGWVCISANYRLRPTAGFPEHLVDVKRVIAWAREHAYEYGANPATVVICGSSAGAHLAALAALSAGDPVFQPGFEPADTRVAAAICLYGYYGRYYGRGEDEQPTSAPLAYDAVGAPPFFLAHGDHDTYVPVEGARDFARSLRAASTSPVTYIELPGGQHAFDLFRSVRFEAVLDGLDTFIGQVLLNPPAADER